ncbi:hypothetical protein D1872_272750 [compost metagenome]
MFDLRCFYRSRKYVRAYDYRTATTATVGTARIMIYWKLNDISMTAIRVSASRRCYYDWRRLSFCG